MASHHRKHGDGVKVIAVAVPDVDRAWAHATEHGANGLVAPCDLTDDHGCVRLATIATYGETLHTFVDRSGYTGAFMPGYHAVEMGADSGMPFGIDHIVATVAELRERGVEFLTIPDAYYDEVPGRVPEVAPQLDDLRKQGILVDHDDEGYLLQIFTKPVGDRPTVFFEVIERHGARGFGDGNFKALFEAIEREQALRGNL